MEGWDPQSVCAEIGQDAEFQEATRETSLARVLAQFLAAKAEAGERQSTLCGYNAAVRAAKYLGWIGVVAHQLHKRIAQAASKLGFQPYLPPDGLCVLMERAELPLGVLPMACMAVLCWFLWLRVGEVSGLRMVDVSLPLWMQFWNSKIGEEGWQSRPLSPLADCFREALLQWAEAKGVQASDHLFPGGSAWLEHKFLRFWVRRLGDTAGGILCAGLVALRVTLATPICSFSSGGGDGAVSARPCNMR